MSFEYELPQRGLLILLLGVGLGQAWLAHSSLAQGRLPSGTEIDRSSLISVQVPASIRTFERLSTHLYGGDPTYAGALRDLNGARTGDAPAGTVRYFAPRYQVAEGDNLEKIGILRVSPRFGAYRELLPLNPSIRDPDVLHPGSWVILPRVPSEQELEEGRRLWIKLKGSIRDWSMSRSRERRRSAATVFTPHGTEERLALTQWYLDRLGSTDLERTDSMVKELLQEPGADWNIFYTAGQYYFRTSRPELARGLFERALSDPGAAIQAALMYLRSCRASQVEPDGALLKDLYERFRPLEALWQQERDQ